MNIPFNVNLMSHLTALSSWTAGMDRGQVAGIISERNRLFEGLRASRRSHPSQRGEFHPDPDTGRAAVFNGLKAEGILVGPPSPTPAEGLPARHGGTPDENASLPRGVESVVKSSGFRFKVQS